MPQPHWTDVEVEEQRFTTWRNPTTREVKVDIFHSPGSRKRFVVKPGEEIKIPSEYDRGVHDVRDGVTVGGYAPQLERVAGTTPLAPALVPQEPADAKSDAPKRPVQAVAEAVDASEKARSR